MKKNYTRQQIFLHWFSAIIIIWGTISGFYVALFDHAIAHKPWVGFVNVSLTTLFIPFFIVRIWYAFRHGKPNDSLLTTRESKMAAIGHLLLYINITVVLISGVLMMERPINIFNFFTLPQPLPQGALTAAFNTAHIISCTTLALLVAGHILAVVKHQMAGKALLSRMRW